MMELFQIGVDILNTSVSTKTRKILAQTGSNVGQGQVDADNVEWWQHVGFASRPAKPVKGKEAAQALVVRTGTIDAAIASQDLRSLPVYGELDHGETCLYAGGVDGKAQGRVLLKKDGSVNIFTKSGNTSGGNGMGIFVNPDGSISIASHNGAAVLIETDGSLKLFNGSGGIQIKADGSVNVASSGKLQVSGASVTLGGPAAQPIALALPTTTALTAIAASLAAIYAVVNGNTPATPVTNGTLAQYLQPLTLLVGLVAAQTLILPSLRTQSD